MSVYFQNGEKLVRKANACGGRSATPAQVKVDSSARAIEVDIHKPI